MKIRFLNVVFIIMLACVCFRLGFVEGHDEANFDRETATRLIHNCNEALTYNKLSEG